MSSLALASFSPALPWAVNPVEQGRARRIAATASVLFVLVSLLLTMFNPPPVNRAEAEKLPPRLAKLVLERKEPPPKPEPVIEKPKEEPKPEVKEEAPKEEVAKPKPTEVQVKQAREKASKSGLLAMKDQLAALRELSAASSLQQPQKQVGAEGTEQRVERDLIGRKATSGSGGVATTAVAHGGGGTLAGRTTTQVEVPAGAGGSLEEVRAKSRAPKRTTEEIKLAFDANKSAIYGLYRRALRQNPLLEGRVVVKLTVEPGGEVTECSIASSALNDPDLEAKLVARIQLINFGARKGVETWTGTYAIDFVPTG